MKVTVHVSKSAVPVHYEARADQGPWDPAAALLRLRAWSGIDDPRADLSAWLRYRDAHAYADEARLRDPAAYLLPHHDLVEHEGWPRMVLSQQGLLAAARAIDQVPEADREAVKLHLADHFHALGLPAPWEQPGATPAAPPPADTGAPMVKTARIVGAAEDKRLVLAIAMRPGVPDTDNQRMTKDVVQRAMHRFALEGGVGGQQNVNHECTGCEHDARGHMLSDDGQPIGGVCKTAGCGCPGYGPADRALYIVQAYQAPADFDTWEGAKLAEPVKEGDGVVVMHVVDDALWGARKHYTGVSIEGAGVPAPAAP